MRKILLAAIAFTTAGCAATPTKQPDATAKVMGDLPEKATIAPHSIARKHQQREDKQDALDGGTKVEGGTVIR